MGWSVVRVLKYALPALALAGLAASCGNTGDPAGTANPSNQQPPGGDYCGTPNEGCPCVTPGAEVDCGEVKNVSGDHVSCSMGRRTCLAGRWGACVGTHITTKSLGTITTQAVTQGPCPASGPLSNPCDPYCHQIVDDTDGGISIGGPPPTSCEYYAPADPSASYLAIPAAYRSLPATCTAGATDNCGHDARCNGGTCTFYIPGQTNSALTGAQVDLTMSTPCVNGAVETIAICNRGSGPANTGFLDAVVQEFSLTGPPATPTTVSMFKQAAPRGPGIRRGNCSLDLTASPIGPGRCISVPLATFCPGADFLSGSGMRTIQFNMPDWDAAPDPPDPRTTTEATRSNNYVVYAAGALLACQGYNCGSANGGISLQTTPNGLSACEPGPNMAPAPPPFPQGACTPANQYLVCQQDHRCDFATGTCVWNGGSGYFDDTLPPGTVDLTVGAACEEAGTENIPVCNRGPGTLPEGTPINIYHGTSSPAPDSCAPSGAPTCTTTAPAGGLGPGKCVNITCAIPGNKYGIVESPGESPGFCANNQAYMQTSGSPGCATCTRCDTRISGHVYDPSGVGAPASANNLPLAGVAVYEPAGPLTSLADTTPVVQCDSCASLESPYMAKAVTDADGHFSLSGVTPGPNRRIVVQSGRWRREITLPMNITACTDNAVPAGTLRMPRSRDPGIDGSISTSIPRIAMDIGSQETLGCLMRRIGIVASEFSGTYGPARITMYRAGTSGGMTIAGAQQDSTLFTLNELSRHHAITVDCDLDHNGSPYDNPTNAAGQAYRQALLDYMNLGGRVFIDHLGGEMIRFAPAPINTSTTWVNPGGPGAQCGKVMTGTPPQQLLYDWLGGPAGAFATPGHMTVVDGNRHAVTPSADSVLWVGGNTGTTSCGTYATPNFALSYSVETPVGPTGTCGATGGRGRFVYNGMHTAAGRGTSGTFPGSCNLGPLSAQEKALEYQLFQLTACQLGGEPPPPPPPPLPATTLTRDYEGVCPVGTYPEWQFLYWQSVTPPGTSIVFDVATADNDADLPPSPPAPPPTTVNAGTATGASVLAPAWASDANTIAWHLANEPPMANNVSRRWLRVYMTFNPIGTVSPILNGIRVDYSCKPNE